MSPTKLQWREACVIGLALLVNFLFVGILFGFPSLQLLLEEDGVYAELCEPDSERCGERTSRLVRAHPGPFSGVIAGTRSSA